MTPPPPAEPPRSRRDRWFYTDDLLHGLGRRSARGGAYTFGSTALNFVVTTTATILITRQLTDEDFGLYGMVIVLTGFAGMFADLGLSRAVVQKPRVTHEQVSTLFWINLGIAAAFAALVAAATPLVVAFYDEPRLAPINLAMSGLFLVNGLSRQHRALLERRMEFARINLIAAAAIPVGAISGVVVALLDGGYWALVAIPAGTAIARTVGILTACDWVPGPPRRRSGVRTMLAFGGHVTGFQIINYFARNADNAMLGYAWGAGPLGLYTRAYSLMMLPAQKLNTPLSAVVVPTLSRLADQPERYRNAFRRTVGLTAAIITPPLVLVIVMSPELIPLLLGDNWTPMIPIFIALSGAALHSATNAAGGWVGLSLGYPDRMLRWASISAPLTIIAMAIGLQWGPLGVAIAVSVAQLSVKFPGFMYITRGTILSYRDLLAPIWFATAASLVAAGFAAGVAYAVVPPLIAPNLDMLLVAASKLTVFAAVYAALSLGTPWGRHMIQGLRDARSIVARPSD